MFKQFYQIYAMILLLLVFKLHILYPKKVDWDDCAPLNVPFYLILYRLIRCFFKFALSER